MEKPNESLTTVQEPVSDPRTQGNTPLSAAAQGARPFPNGATANSGQEANPKEKRNVKRVLLPILLVFLVAGALISFKYWYNDAFYVSTENAKINGALIQVGALNAGRIDNIATDVGGRVERDQVVATVAIPSVVSVAQGTSKIGFLSTDELRAEVRSPLSGIVVARVGNVGDTVAAGQPVLTVVDPNSLWVSANIEETKISRVKAGQLVEIRVDALDQTFSGHVQSITPATAATFSLLPQQNGSGNFTKVTQLMPVKIAVDTNGQTLPFGGSVEIRIKVAEPAGWLSWLP